MFDVMETLDLAENTTIERARQESFHSIVHDLRNPLTAICGCAEMLLEANLNPAQSKRVTTNIHRAAGRMKDLLTALTRAARGQTESVQLCNLREVLTASCEAAGVTDRNHIDLFINVPDRIEVTLPRARMQRAFTNLILNAMEVLPDGGQIRITAVEAGEYVRIVVEDNGPGISPEIRSRLFQPFVTAGKKEGVGLGLASSRQTLRDHGGDLWLEAAAGARFVMSLPLNATNVATNV